MPLCHSRLLSRRRALSLSLSLSLYLSQIILDRSLSQLLTFPNVLVTAHQVPASPRVLGGVLAGTDPLERGGRKRRRPSKETL